MGDLATTTPGEILSFGVVVCITVGLLVRSAAVRREWILLVVALVLVTGVSAAAARFGRPEIATPLRDVPASSNSLEYVTSAACLGCHPGEHASFSRTFHRTMTQVATPSSVLAPVKKKANGEVWLTIDSIDRRVALTTGSHREQAYWVLGKQPGDPLELAPFVWFVREKQLVARRDAFILPPDAQMPKVRWSSSCIACHAVAGEPRQERGNHFDTRVAELGIACEACHGPGREHVERFRDPIARYSVSSSSSSSSAPNKLSIVHPKKIAPERSAAVCGQCHAYAFPRDENDWWTHGYATSFRAGDALEPSRFVLSNLMLRSGSGSAPVMIDAAASSIFWPDGAVRVGGREYNGLVESPCYLVGEGDRKMTCLSCHSMHKGDPAGQIDPEHVGSESGCTSSSCHTSEKSRNHGHHAAGSPGNACVSCHMTKTSFALLSAVRSHRIEIPRIPNASAREPKPNACNLCHLDRSPAWTARTLKDWYRVRSTPEATDEQPAGLRDGLAGDANERALIADALGSADARAAIKTDGFQRALLEEMKRRETYPAVRFIAERSLASLPPPSSSSAATMTRFASAEEIDRLVLARDNTPLTIAE